MSGPQLSLAISVFLACAVEAVEAFTIVLAVGKHSQVVLGPSRGRRRDDAGRADEFGGDVDDRFHDLVGDAGQG